MNFFDEKVKEKWLEEEYPKDTLAWVVEKVQSFDVIGFTEQLHDFYERMRKILQVDTSDQRTNITPKEAYYNFSISTLNTVKKAVEQDSILYWKLYFEETKYDADMIGIS